ncbi:MAG: aldo/keto reductase [Candidatus Latescibacterota bacterium]
MTDSCNKAASMQELVAQGKTRYWGVSNHSAAQLRPYLDRASIAGIEEYYNIAGTHLDAEGRSRTSVFEQEVQPLLAKYQIGCMAFSPMAPGRHTDPPLRALVETIDDVAAQLGVGRASICVAWLAQQPGISSVLCGAESSEQLDANLRGIELELPAESIAQLTQARYVFRSAQNK